jgi:hypothetical protein
MIEIARVSAQSSIGPDAFHAAWCDLASHTDWATEMEYLRLAEPFALGARGVLKTKTGSEAPFVVTALEPGRIYADTTELDGAGLTVRHEATPTSTGSHLELSAFLEGPRAAEWAAQMGGVQEILRADLAALIGLLEHRSTAASQ